MVRFDSPWQRAAEVAVIALTALVAIVATFLWLRAISGGAQPGAAGLPTSLGPCRPLGDGAAFAGDPMLVGADVGASAPLGDGRIVWAYGDTFRRADGRTLTAVRNTLVIETGDCRSVVIPAGGQEAIPDRADGVGYWPMSIAVTRANGAATMYVYAQRVMGSERRFAFDNLGPSVATFVIPDGGAPILMSVRDFGPDDPSRRNVGWGAASADGGDGYWYLFGTANPEEAMVFGWSVRVARARPEGLGDPGQWEYWTSAGWQSDPARATEVIGAVDGVSQTFSVLQRAARWYAISKRDGDLGTDLGVWSADAPWGPYAAPVTVGRIPNETVPPVLRYMPLAHPEVTSVPAGTVRVSVCRNSTDPDLLADRPELYRPYFVDIALPPLASQALLQPGG